MMTAERLKSAIANAETCVAALRTDRAEDLPDEVKDALCDLAIEMASTVWDVDSQPVQFGERWVLGIVLHPGPEKPTVLVTSVSMRDLAADRDAFRQVILRRDVLQDGFGPAHSDFCCRDRLARALPVLLRLLEEAVVGATGGMAGREARTAKTALPRVQALRAEAELLVAARAVLGS